MSSPRPTAGRAAVVLVALAALGGCAGYQPLYGLTPTEGTAPGAATISEALAQVSVERIPERTGQMLRERLIERLATGTATADATWPLRVSLEQNTSDLGIQRDASATRASLSVSADILLADPDGQIVLSRRLNVITAYSILDDQFATLVAERDARERALDDLADQIRTQLALYFARPPAPREDEESGPTPSAPPTSPAPTTDRAPPDPSSPAASGPGDDGDGLAPDTASEDGLEDGPA